MPGAVIRSLRPEQWTKNLFILAPLIFGGRLHQPEPALRSLLAVALFCAASSAVYLLNDLRDREEDRRHPFKRLRPIATGLVSPAVAVTVMLALAAIAVGGAAWLGRGVLLWTLIYLGLQLLYSFGLKRVVILDVMLIAVGFALRVLAGGAAASVRVSSWLLLCTLFVALFLAVSKRRHELALAPGDGADQRAVLSHYSVAFLDQMINVVTASTVVAYALYAISPDGDGGVGADPMLWTVPLVLFGIFRYLYLVYQRPAERSPTESLLADAPFLVNLAIWGAAVLWIFYFR